MITEYPLEHRRYDGSEYEPFWAAAEALGLPLSGNTARVYDFDAARLTVPA
jgi:hypothetical protein